MQTHKFGRDEVIELSYQETVTQQNAALPEGPHPPGSSLEEG